MDSQSLRFETTDHALRLSAAGCTQRGTKRENNEDSIHLSPNLEVLIVADGVGGSRAGELASSTAIREVVEQTDHWPVTGDDNLFRQLIDEALHRASRVIRELVEIDDEFWGAATTMTMAFRADNHLFIANVGDSRAYRLRNGRLERLTVDDSWVEILVRAGSITREEARNHPQRNVIMTSLGGKEFDEQAVEVGVMNLLPGDRFLISSDGLHDVLEDEEISTLLGVEEPVEVIASSLMDRAVQAGSADDISVVVFDVSQCERARDLSASVYSRAVERVRAFFAYADEPATAAS
jgi:serine/threonine protein phosphatase PrpC